jgi:hypothetical protein
MRRGVARFLLVLVQRFLGLDLFSLPAAFLHPPFGKLLLLLVLLCELVIASEDHLGACDEEFAVLETELGEAIHLSDIRLFGLRDCLGSLFHGRRLIPRVAKVELFNILRRWCGFEVVGFECVGFEIVGIHSIHACIEQQSWCFICNDRVRLGR